MQKLFKMMRRKGISPLVATVLLIAFAVALGALVISFGQNFLKSQIGTADEVASGSLQCTYITIDYDEVVFDIDGGDSISGHANEAVLNVSFTVESELTLRIKDFKLVAKAEDGQFVNFDEVDTDVNSGAVPLDVTAVDFRRISYFVDLTAGAEDTNITEVTIIPIIATNDGADQRACINQQEDLTSDSSKWIFV